MARNTPNRGGLLPDISRLNEEAKDDSLNASLTKSFSLKSIETLLLGKSITNKSRCLYEGNAETLLENLSIDDCSIQGYIGPDAINDEIWNLEIKRSINALPILRFIECKKHLAPYSFLKIVEVMTELSNYHHLKYQNEEATKEDFKDLSLYTYIISNSTQPNYVKDVLLQFHKLAIDPFYKEDNVVLWERKKRTVQDFQHPTYKRYIKYLLRNRILPQTERSYQGILKRFFIWLTTILEEFKSYNMNDVPIYKIKREHLQDYKRYLLIQVKHGNRSLNKASDDLYVIKDFFQHLYQNKQVLQDITQQIGAIKQKKYHYRDLPNKEELMQFFNTVELYAEDPLTDGLAFGFLYNNGLRVSEMANLQWENVNLERNTISLKRKGNKSCVIYIPSILRTKLKQLFEMRKDYTFVFSEKPESFKKKIREHYMVYAKLAGWTFPNNVHIFRHIFITYLTENNCSPQALKELADVENLETLSYYFHRSEERLIDEVNKLDLNF
ncbi:hypothetical protein E3U55_14385 [Filobacillus milosensis]|uniref:Site-specific integrase n=1 Tax=Filobacillus milosensis TaxID=94137 RepID=A0A4Y8IDP0_9BACI|nr:tyrosine-type recombinase/integrase [Filobacillus milosensis]TFB14102.1 hypothetical protein E3U55_14385 [Filobacillus milosensis]